MARRDYTGKHRYVAVRNTPNITSGTGAAGTSVVLSDPAYYFGSFIASVGGEYSRNGNCTEIPGCDLNWRIQDNFWYFAFSSPYNCPNSEATTMFYNEDIVREFNTTRKDHLGNIHHKFEVVLDPDPATTIVAHGIDTSKIIYYNWYTATDAKDVIMTDTGNPFIRSGFQAESKVTSITFDSTNATIETVAGQVAGYVIFEIITTP